MSELVLHIGTKKTGTTFIQRYLQANAENLRAQGLQTPSFVENANHLRYAVPFQRAITKEHRARAVTDDTTRAAYIATLAEELRTHVKPGQRWLLTSEHFSTRLQTRAEVDAAVAFLRQFFDSITVLVWFRRQEFMFPSIFSQAVKDGDTPTWSWKFCEKRLDTLDYLAMYQRWSTAVGADNVRATPYMDSNKTGDSFLTQFAAAAGFVVGPGWVMPPRDDANASLSAEGIAFMRVVNPYLPFLRPDDRSNYTLRQAAIGRVMALTPGPNFHPGPEVLDQITEHYADGNAALVAALGDGPEWADWLAQPIHSGKPPVAVPPISPERVAELMVAISEPDGPVAWGRPAGRPVRVKELVRDAGRRYVGGITAKAKQLRQR